MNDAATYVSENIAKGIPPEQIKQALITSGWDEKDIEQFFPHPKGAQTTARYRLPANLPSWLLRIGIAFVFLYAAIFVTGNATTGGKYVPELITTLIPLNTFLILFGVFEVLLAVWVLTGKFKIYSGTLAAITLIAITSIDSAYFSATFRNIAIICACLAFALL